MADVNKSIQINVEADLKQLLKNLQKIPGMTKEEAKKMVSSLSSELKKAEKTAERTAKKTKVGMKQIEVSAKKAAVQTRNLRSQSRDLGAAFGSLEDVIGVMSPELAGAAMALGTLGQGFRTLSRSMATGSPIILGVIGTLAALAAIYTAVTMAQQKAAEMQKAYQEGTKELNKTLKEQRKIAEGVVGDLIDQKREFDVLTGALSQHKADLLDLEDARKQAIKTRLQGQDEVVARAKADTNIVRKAVQDVNGLTEAEEKRLQILMAMSKDPNISKGLGGVGEQGTQLRALQNEVNKKLKEQINFRLRLEENVNKAFDLRKEMLELQKEFAEETKKEEERQKNIAKAQKTRQEQQAKFQKKQAENVAKEQKQIQQFMKQIQSLKKEQDTAIKETSKITEEAAKIRIGLIDDESEKSKQLFSLEERRIEKQIQSIQDQISANEALKEQDAFKQEAIVTEIELKKQIAALEELLDAKRDEFSKKEEKRKKKENKLNQISADAIAGYYIDTAKATSNLITMTSKKNKEAALIAYRVAQAAAIAEITINTAKEISKVAANPLAVAGVATLGAVQIATVAATPPPEFHMGGLIKGDDTRQVTALTGEAILDRRTVSRLGGERGVNALQRGQNKNNQVIVVQPFKHFDRFVDLNSRRGGSMAQIKRRKGAGGF
tara:strand:+ start:372 stop:2369 length:1998 start_codon:yes stop_codon:yes gene_type:complete